MATQWQHALDASKAIGRALGITVTDSVVGISFGTVNEISIGKHYSIRDSHIENYPWRVFKIDKDGKESTVGSFRNWSTAVYAAYDELLKEIINGMISVELEAESLGA